VFPIKHQLHSIQTEQLQAASARKQKNNGKSINAVAVFLDAHLDGDDYIKQTLLNVSSAQRERQTRSRWTNQIKLVGWLSKYRGAVSYSSERKPLQSVHGAVLNTISALCGHMQNKTGAFRCRHSGTLDRVEKPRDPLIG
jgi:hypothetical protein